MLSYLLRRGPFSRFVFIINLYGHFNRNVLTPIINNYYLKGPWTVGQNVAISQEKYDHHQQGWS